MSVDQETVRGVAGVAEGQPWPWLLQVYVLVLAYKKS